VVGGSRIKPPVLNNFSPIYYWGAIFWVEKEPPNDVLLGKVHEVPFLLLLPFFGGQSALDKKKNGFFGLKFS